MSTFPTPSLPVTSSTLTDVLQQLAVLQTCPTSSVASTSTAMMSPTLSFPTVSPIPSVNLFPPLDTGALGLQIDPVQSLLVNPNLLQASPQTVEAIANALFATTSRRASCPEPPATSQAPILSSVDNLQVPAERRRYSEASLDVLIREQLAQLMPPTSQLPGMPGCYTQYVPAGIQAGAGRMASTSSSIGSVHSRRTAGHRKARTIYGTTQTQQLEDTFQGQMYVVGAERESLALRLGLSPSQVRIWFQNRRSKHRRKQQEEQEPKKDE